MDVDSLEKALELVRGLHPYVGCFKIGLELLTNEGAPKVIKAIQEVGGKVFYDGKFKDIPNTVAGATRAVTRLDVKMFNVHCLGGAEMMKTARKTAEDEAALRGGMGGVPRPLVLGVTILTSLDYNDLVEMGLMKELNIADPEEKKATETALIRGLVKNLALLAQESGLDGVIASPQEIEAIREYCQPEFLIVTPGVRPRWAAVGDQKRVMSPGEAVKIGADYLVIGRPITKPPSEIGGPIEAAKKIAEEIENAIRDEALAKVRKTLEMKTGSPAEVLESCQSSWFYAAQEGEPHAILASGKHSDGYINLNAVLQFPNLCEILARQLIIRLEAQGITKEKIDAVVSSSFAAITFGQEVSRQLNVLFVFTEKVGEDQKWGGRFELPAEARILQVEELITTTHTTRKVKEAVLVSNPQVKFLEINGKTVVATIVYRPEDLSKEDPEFEVIALIPKEIHIWEPDKCPLCQKGSPALKPKPNWQRFLQHK